jgi:DNA-binding IclR family transcriptional regulator
LKLETESEKASADNCYPCVWKPVAKSVNHLDEQVPLVRETNSSLFHEEDKTGKNEVSAPVTV